MIQIEEAIKYLERHGFIADVVKDMCIEALDKQIPKKPILEERHNSFSCDNWKCPNCETEFSWDIEADLKAKEYHNCPYCGQVINGGDWSEESV